jgi:hypothetical protein
MGLTILPSIDFGICAGDPVAQIAGIGEVGRIRIAVVGQATDCHADIGGVLSRPD